MRRHGEAVFEGKIVRALVCLSWVCACVFTRLFACICRACVCECVLVWFPASEGLLDLTPKGLTDDDAVAEAGSRRGDGLPLRVPTHSREKRNE